MPQPTGPSTKARKKTGGIRDQKNQNHLDHSSTKIGLDTQKRIRNLIDFNGLSTSIGMFYAIRSANRVHCTFIPTFFVFSCFFHTTQWNTNDF